MKKHKNRLTQFIGTIALVLVVGQSTMAQSSSISGFRRSFATVMFCGLGGAVLGLSTLSFYGKPDEHIGNVSTGFAIGIIGGVAFAAADTVQSTRKVESYSLHDNINGKPMARVAKSDVIFVPLILTDF